MERRPPYAAANANPDPAYHVAGMELWEAKARLVLALEEVERLRRQRRVAMRLVCRLLEGEG